MHQMQPKWQLHHRMLPSHAVHFLVFSYWKIFSFFFWIFISILQMTLKQLPGNSDSEFESSHFWAWRMTQYSGFWLICASSVLEFESICCAPVQKFEILTFFHINRNILHWELCLGVFGNFLSHPVAIFWKPNWLCCSKWCLYVCL